MSQRRVFIRSLLGRGSSLAVAIACSTPSTPDDPKGEPSPAERKSSPSTRVRVPEGSFSSGTQPGQLERQPELEPRTERVALGPFEMDVGVYPGGTEAPLLGATRERARELCAARGGRLCTELEWERACKGPQSSAFANGERFEPTCLEAAASCPSGFGAHGLGQLREWTASDVEGGPSPRAALRGASRDAPAAHHRCAHRSPASAPSMPDVAFRCCYGAPNAARVNAPSLGTTFTKIDLSIGDLGELLASDPATRALAQDLAFFEEPGGTEAVLAKGNRDTQGFLLTTSPLLWSPALGADFLVLSARSGKATSFVVVFHAPADGTRRLASSFVMQGEAGPVALAYNGYIRPRLHFSTCWGCAGETGKILYRDPDRAVILQP